MQETLDYLDFLSPLSVELRNFFQKKIKTRLLPQGEYSLQPGQSDTNVYFIKKGLIRCYKIENNKVVKMRFLAERQIAVSAQYVFGLKENREYMQPLEDCELLYINVGDAKLAAGKFPDFRRLAFKLYGEYVGHHHMQFVDIPQEQGMDRYKLMLEQYPGLVKRIPLDILADYLRMDPAELKICIDKLKAPRKAKQVPEVKRLPG